MDLSKAAARVRVLNRLATQATMAGTAVRQAEVETGRLLHDTLEALELEPGHGTLREGVGVLTVAFGKLLKLSAEIGEAVTAITRASARAGEDAEAIEAQRQAELNLPVRHEGGRGPDLVCACHGEAVDSVDRFGLCQPCRRDLDRRARAGDAGASAELAAFEARAAEPDWGPRVVLGERMSRCPHGVRLDGPICDACARREPATAPSCLDCGSDAVVEASLCRPCVDARAAAKAAALATAQRLVDDTARYSAVTSCAHEQPVGRCRACALGVEGAGLPPAGDA